MATYWHFTKSDEFENKISEIKQKFEDCSLIEADLIVKNEGAFVRIENKEDAEKILLHNTVIIYGENIADGYEKAINEFDFSQAVFVSAESKTADIEKKLISGVHGAKECHFVVIQPV
ncbi:conserved hypothetical protein [Thermotomaculum hydrothermale]|uniref:LUD domain-containing protein n=1 Tax=Thermotomaculum hydrothermale TaxID=981385 RepID=A0A7R6PM69_9BACT|nr:hypothetical protein [Thermotomaculum hydrothermale]BBB31686.1 conserved hypothetical protein [Thermotomaculum hydrothermale]